MAIITEEMERYDDMLGFMKEIVEMGKELTDDERNLL